ncbi:hypothetical protein [Streptomyces sp. NBC_01092]|uniref:hypothetical protein n=1 Tax=Streptomyces sp. NBC_01092 TaxID=2903748 RepID=UPI0038700D96|nr:hypothetical protein OG254_00555 [Streptomyces sp. NBC_01092]
MTILHFHGSAYGIYSQLGYLDHERESERLADYSCFRGSSSGSLTALVAAYGLSGRSCVAAAVDLAQEWDLFGRPWSYLGRVHSFIDELLSHLLSGASQQRQLEVIATRLPTGQSITLRPAWNDQAEAIRMCHASMHIPILCSFAPWFRHGPYRAVDGALHSPFPDPGEDTVVVNAQGRFTLLSPAQIWRQYERAEVRTTVLRKSAAGTFG